MVGIWRRLVKKRERRVQQSGGQWPRDVLCFLGFLFSAEYDCLCRGQKSLRGAQRRGNPDLKT
jgi:hypothetical protein